jgi:hypothetical protein
MRIVIRPSVPADASAIVELLMATGLEPNVEPAALDWKYWRQREDWTGARSFVATRGTQIVAHAAVVPGSCATQSHRVTVLHLLDWAARSEAAGVGVSLMKHVGRLADALLSVGGSDQTLQIMPHVGFRPCGTVEGYVRVLHPLRFRDAFEASPWKRTARLARRSLWRLTSPFVEPVGWNIRRIAADEMTALAEALPRGTAGLGVFERSEGLFRYMLHCPIVPMELYALISQNHVRGYLLLAFAPGQARIADCWVATDEPAAWQALIQYAALQAWRHRDVAEIVAWSSDAVMTRALVAGGFHRRSQTPILLRFATADGAIPERFRLQMLDNDAAYLHRRFAEWWA